MTDKEMNEVFGNYLRNLRLKKGYTMQYVADRMGFKNRSSIANYEMGRATMSISTMKQICDIYGYDFRDVLKDIMDLL